MKVLEGGRVYLEAGEVMPMFCGCGEVYQPPLYSLKSFCPKCKVLNDHKATTEREVLS